MSNWTQTAPLNRTKWEPWHPNRNSHNFAKWCPWAPNRTKWEPRVPKQQRNIFAAFPIPANRYLQTCNDLQQHRPNLQRHATNDNNCCQTCNDSHNKKPLHSDECNGSKYETRVKTENLFYYVVVIPLMMQNEFSNSGLISKRT